MKFALLLYLWCIFSDSICCCFIRTTRRNKISLVKNFSKRVIKITLIKPTTIKFSEFWKLQLFVTLNTTKHNEFFYGSCFNRELGKVLSSPYTYECNVNQKAAHQTKQFLLSIVAKSFYYRLLYRNHNKNEHQQRMINMYLFQKLNTA